MEKHNITISDETGEIRLVSLMLSKSGDVYVALPALGQFRDPGTPRGSDGSPDHNVDIQELRFSLHPSLRSLRDNRINSHMLLRNGHSKDVSSRTDVIKGSKGFIILFSRQCAGMPITKLSKAKVHSLGSMEREEFSLVFTLLVSNVDLTFKNQADDINDLSFVVGSFRFTVLWSFFPSTSPPMGLTVSLTINSDESAGDSLDRVTYGDEKALCDVHRTICYNTFQEYVETVMNTMVFETAEEYLLIRKIISNYTMLKTASKKTVEYAQHCSRSRSTNIDRVINIGIRG